MRVTEHRQLVDGLALGVDRFAAAFVALHKRGISPQRNASSDTSPVS
jgi:hypothetical protein